VWLLEASVLFYLANKTSSYKLSLAALTLFIIGVLRITPFLDTNLSGDYGFIVALCAITASLVYNVILLYSPKT